MKLALMQPYLFPYLGYFTLMKLSDKFIVFDSAQYMKGGWVNRNRVLHPNLNEDPLYISVPIQRSSVDTKIKDMKINDKQNWKQKIIGQLQTYKKIAPNYNEVLDFVNECFKFETDSLAEMNVFLLKKTCEYLGLPINMDILSELNLNLEEVNESDEWGLNVAKAFGAETYINSPGGRSFYDSEKYKQNHIKLEFIQSHLIEYEQNRDRFEPGLSILDVMMFNNNDQIHKMLDEYEVL